jgi:TctA family transporter
MAGDSVILNTLFLQFSYPDKFVTVKTKQLLSSLNAENMIFSIDNLLIFGKCRSIVTIAPQPFGYNAAIPLSDVLFWYLKSSIMISVS